MTSAFDQIHADTLALSKVARLNVAFLRFVGLRSYRIAA